MLSEMTTRKKRKTTEELHNTEKIWNQLVMKVEEELLLKKPRE